MKIKLGPVEIEQDPIKDELFFDEYKKSPKAVEKYLEEKSKLFDLSLKNIIAGRTTRLIMDAAFSIAGGVAFVGWIIYVFYVSKDSFVWEELGPQTVLSVLLQALLILFICFLPVILIGVGFLIRAKVKGSKKPEKNIKEEKK